RAGGGGWRARRWWTRHLPGDSWSARAGSGRHERPVGLGDLDLGELVPGAGIAGWPPPAPLRQDDPAGDEQVATPDPVLLAAFDRGVETSPPHGAVEADPLGGGDVVELDGEELRGVAVAA